MQRLVKLYGRDGHLKINQENVKFDQMFTQLARIKQSVAYQSKQLAHQEKKVDEMTRRRQEREVLLPFFIRKVNKKVDP